MFGWQLIDLLPTQLSHSILWSVPLGFGRNGNAVPFLSGSSTQWLFHGCCGGLTVMSGCSHTYYKPPQGLGNGCLMTRFHLKWSPSTLYSWPLGFWPERKCCPIATSASIDHPSLYWLLGFGEHGNAVSFLSGSSTHGLLWFGSCWNAGQFCDSGLLTSTQWLHGRCCDGIRVLAKYFNILAASLW